MNLNRTPPPNRGHVASSQEPLPLPSNLNAFPPIAPPPPCARSTEDDFTPVTRRGGKRARVGTPPSNLRPTDAINKAVNEIRGKIGMAAPNLKGSNNKELFASIQAFLSTTLIQCFEAQASAMSDMAESITLLNCTITEMQSEIDSLNSELSEAKTARDSIQVKDSAKDMESLIRDSMTKSKVLDIDFGCCLTDRKQLIDMAKNKLREKVRSDLRAKYDKTMQRAAVAVIARQTTRRAYPSGEIWTAPILVSLPDRDTKMELEDMLRQSNCYPAFHWPKEMIEPVKTLKKIINEGGVPDSSHYIRIRPDERDGRLRIRADIKPKAAGSKFSLKATWKIPAADAKLRQHNKDWAKPTWVSPPPPRQTLLRLRNLNKTSISAMTSRL